MDSISDFISQKEEIERLNKQIDMLAGFYHGFYKKKIKKLKSQSSLNDRRIKLALKRNRMYEKRLGMTSKPSMREKAIAMIKDNGLPLHQIAKTVGLSYSRVRVLSSELKDKKC